MYNFLKNQKFLFVFTFLIIISKTSLAENINYSIEINCINQDSLAVNINLNCHNYHKLFLLSTDMVIKELEIQDNKKISYILRNDSLILKDSIKVLHISYMLPKKKYMLSYSNSIILKNEGKWYPAISNSIINADIIFKNVQEYEIIAGKKINDRFYKFEYQPNLSVFLLPKLSFKKDKLDSLNVKITFYEYKQQCPFKNDKNFKSEFVKSIKFYRKLFNAKPFNNYNVIAIPDKNFQICQSFSSGVIFGQDYFYKLYKMDTLSSWIPHEVAHQWWSFSILSDIKASNYRFFEESITEFLKVNYIKKIYGDSTYNKLLKRYVSMFNYVIKDSLDIPISKIYSLNSQSNSIIIYCKGPLILNKYITENMKFNKFQDFLRLFYTKHNKHLASFDLFNNELSEFVNKKNIGLANLLNLKGKCWK